MYFNKVSLLWIIITALEAIGFLLSLIGYGGNYIVSAKAGGDYGHCGLWNVCDSRNCFDTAFVAEYKGGSRVWVDASRGMMSIAIVCQFLVIFLTALTLCITNTKLMGWLTPGIAGFSVLNGLIGLAVAAGKGTSFMEDVIKLTFGLDWSFTLFIIGQFTFVFAATGHYWNSRTLLQNQTRSRRDNV